MVSRRPSRNCATTVAIAWPPTKFRRASSSARSCPKRWWVRCCGEHSRPKRAQASPTRGDEHARGFERRADATRQDGSALRIAVNTDGLGRYTDTSTVEGDDVVVANHRNRPPGHDV